MFAELASIIVYTMAEDKVRINVLMLVLPDLATTAHVSDNTIKKLLLDRWKYLISNPVAL